MVFHQYFEIQVAKLSGVAQCIRPVQSVCGLRWRVEGDLSLFALFAVLLLHLVALHPLAIPYYLLLFLQVLNLIGQVFVHLVIVVLLSIMCCGFIGRVHMDNVTSCLNQHFAHFQVTLSRSIEQGSLDGDFIYVVYVN